MKNRPNFTHWRLIEDTFNERYHRLPSAAIVKRLIERDDCDVGEDDWLMKRMAATDTRHEYVKHSYPILTNELLVGLVKLIRYLRLEDNTIELAGGKGWLSHWLIKYGIDVLACIDDKSWKGRGNGPYLDLVTKGNAVEEMVDGPCLYILSWPPYDDPLAYNIWNNMKKGQYLLYIGEAGGGCTADSKFEEAIGEDLLTDWDTCKDRDIKPPMISFDGIHDEAMLFKKGDTS